MSVPEVCAVFENLLHLLKTRKRWALLQISSEVNQSRLCGQRMGKPLQAPNSSDLNYIVLNLHKGLPLWKRWAVEKESLSSLGGCRLLSLHHNTYFAVFGKDVLQSERILHAISSFKSCGTH